MLGASFGSAAKGTGLKALEFALSICESVDMYGFTVDPGYKEWYVVTHSDFNWRSLCTSFYVLADNKEMNSFTFPIQVTL